MKKSLLLCSFTFCLFTAAFSQNQEVVKEKQQNGSTNPQETSISVSAREELVSKEESSVDPQNTGSLKVTNNNGEVLYIKKNEHMTIITNPEKQ